MAKGPGRIPDKVVERLYAAHPEGFVAARTEAAARARAAGDTATAARISKLRRPTIAAWLVNLLALRRPDLVAELGDLATTMRAAQRELRGDELRGLSTQRRALVASLVAVARDLAVDAVPGTDPARLPLGEVENTLNAALADPDVAAEVAAGMLTRSVTYVGFGEVPRPRLRLVTGGEADGPGAPSPAAGPASTSRGTGAGGRAGSGARDVAASRRELDAARRDVEQTRRDLDEALTGRDRAQTELEEAVAAEHEGADELAEIETQLAEWERRRSAAEQELSRRKLARRAAERAAVAARRRHGEAEAMYEDARTVYEQARSTSEDP